MRMDLSALGSKLLCTAPKMNVRLFNVIIFFPNKNMDVQMFNFVSVLMLADPRTHNSVDGSLFNSGMSEIPFSSCPILDHKRP